MEVDTFTGYRPLTLCDINLCIYNIRIYYLYRSISDIIHPTNPFHLIVCFELFGHALTLCHLFYKSRKHILCLFVDVCKVSIQFATC